MLLAVPVAVLAPRAPALTLGVLAAYTAASLFNPLVPINESTVALVLLVGAAAIVWRATHPASGDLSPHLPARPAARAGNA